MLYLCQKRRPEYVPYALAPFLYLGFASEVQSPLIHPSYIKKKNYITISF